MIPETGGVYAVFNGTHSMHRRVIAWDDNGNAQVAHTGGYLVTARSQPGFSHLEGLEWWGKADLIQIVPGDGARVVHENSEPPGLTSPVLVWGLNREGDLVAVVPDGTGMLDTEENPTILMTKDGEHIIRDPKDQQPDGVDGPA